MPFSRYALGTYVTTRSGKTARVAGHERGGLILLEGYGWHFHVDLRPAMWLEVANVVGKCHPTARIFTRKAQRR
jgi:hypothetical protein